MNQAEIPNNLTSNRNKSHHSSSPKTSPFLEQLTTVLLGRKLQVSRLRHLEAPRVLLLSYIHSHE